MSLKCKFVTKKVIPLLLSLCRHRKIIHIVVENISVCFSLIFGNSLGLTLQGTLGKNIFKINNEKISSFCRMSVENLT
jgi:hypothetical protein